MKRIGSFLALCALGVASVFLAAADSGGKIDWCHFPPGQWTGDRSTSKYLVLSIDTSGISGHAGHAGDGPVSTLGSSCTGNVGATVTCGTVDDPNNGTMQLVQGTGAYNGQCVCPNSLVPPHLDAVLQVPACTSGGQ